MANHKVIMREPKKLLRKKDVEFAIRIDGELMGTLLVSRGSLDYRPAHGKSLYTKNWKTIHEFFTGSKWQKSGVVDDFDDSDVD